MEYSGKLQRLISMVQQIADNNKHHGHTEANAEVIAGHIIKFWARPMKNMIIDHFQNSAEHPCPNIRAALQKVTDHGHKLAGN